MTGQLEGLHGHFQLGGPRALHRHQLPAHDAGVASLFAATKFLVGLVPPAAVRILGRDDEVDGFLGRLPQGLVAGHQEGFPQNDRALAVGVHPGVAGRIGPQVAVRLLVADQPAQAAAQRSPCAAPTSVFGRPQVGQQSQRRGGRVAAHAAVQPPAPSGCCCWASQRSPRATAASVSVVPPSCLINSTRHPRIAGRDGHAAAVRAADLQLEPLHVRQIRVGRVDQPQLASLLVRRITVSRVWRSCRSVFSGTGKSNCTSSAGLAISSWPGRRIFVLTIAFSRM